MDSLDHCSTVCSAVCSVESAREEAGSSGVWEKLKDLSVGFIARLGKTNTDLVTVLTAPRLKDPKDICVWKICSRQAALERSTQK